MRITIERVTDGFVIYKWDDVTAEPEQHVAISNIGVLRKLAAFLNIKSLRDRELQYQPTKEQSGKKKPAQGGLSAEVTNDERSEA